MKKNIFKILFVFLPIIILGFFIGLNLEIKIANACTGSFCPFSLPLTPPPTNNPPATVKPSSSNSKTCYYKICSQNNITGKVFCATQSSSDPNCQSRSNCTNDSDCGSSNNASNTTDNTPKATSKGPNITPQTLTSINPISSLLPPEVINNIKDAVLKELGGIQAAMQLFKDLGLTGQMSFDDFLFSYGLRSFGMIGGFQVGTSNIQKTEIPEFKNYVWEVGLPGLVKPAGSLPLGNEGVPTLVAYFIKAALRISGLLVFAMIAYAGFQYLTAGGNASKQKEAQERIISAVIGLLLLFAFYIILYTINPDILKTEISAPSTSEETSGGGGGGSSTADGEEEPTEPETTPTNKPQQIGNFVLIGPGAKLDSYSIIPVSYEFPNGAYIHKGTADKLVSLAKKAPSGWQVTEACVTIENNKCKPTTTHQSECHYLGTCVDIGYGGDPGGATRMDFINAANQAGFDVLDEYLCPSSGSGFHVVPASSSCNRNNACWFCANK